MSLKQRFHSLGASVVDVFTSRVDLAAAELEDLLLRVGGLLMILLIAVLAGAFTLMFLGIAMVVAVPEPFRWIPALGCAVFFGLGALGCSFTLWRNLRDMPAPFASTRDVLHRDAAAIRPAIENTAQAMDPSGASN